MKLLVTGGSGFTGGHLIPILVDGGYRVAALVRSDTAARRIAALGALPVRGDLDDPVSTRQAFMDAGADGLVNLASLGFGHAPLIVAAAEEAGIGRAVFVSTTAIFTGLAAPSKPTRLAAEQAVMSSSLCWTIVRPTMIYGAPGDRNMERLLRFLRRTPVVPLPGGGRGLQQPVHVDDLAMAIASAITEPAAAGGCYDIAGPDAHSLRAVVTAAAQAVGRRPVLLPVPLAPVVGALRTYEKTYEKRAHVAHLRAEQLARLAEDKAFEITSARRDLGYCPRSFADGIAAEAAML